MVGIVSRFAAQKGFDLITQIANDLARLPLIVTVLGSGDKEYEEMFRRLQRQFPEKFAVKVAYDNAIAHKIEAGRRHVPDVFTLRALRPESDLQFEIWNGTHRPRHGGLDDSIEPWNPATEKGTGFKFTAYSGATLLGSIQEALQAFKDKAGWKKLMINGMSEDFSWTASAKEYARLYERLAG